MKILITGSEGFIGKNLCAYLEGRGYTNLLKYDKSASRHLLDQYAAACDFVIHLAGINRPKDTSDFEENHSFTADLLESLAKNQKIVPVLMSSSLQAMLNNPYGLSKRMAEALVFEYGRDTGADVYVYRLPGVFGKWCAPNYNSVVATFCHNIARGLPIHISDPDAKIKLVHIDDVMNAFLGALDGNVNKWGGFCFVENVYDTHLGNLAGIIQGFKTGRQSLLVEDMSDAFIHALYSTYLSYLPKDDFSYELKVHSDNRGSFAECLKSAACGQLSVNIAKPATTKGGHWHHTKTEKILVVSGSGVIRFQKYGEDKVLLYPVSSEKLEVVDIPAGYAHDVTNTGEDDMVMLIWSNQIFNPDDTDTFPMKIGARDEMRNEE